VVGGISWVYAKDTPRIDLGIATSITITSMMTMMMILRRRRRRRKRRSRANRLIVASKPAILDRKEKKL